MKKLIILLFTLIFTFTSYCQEIILAEADTCFNNGDYDCAEAKFKEVFKSSVGKEKQIAEIKIHRAKKCIVHIKNADIEFNNKNYIKAKEKYLLILESNSNDYYAKSQIEICDNFLNFKSGNKNSNSKSNIKTQKISHPEKEPQPRDIKYNESKNNKNSITKKTKENNTKNNSFVQYLTLENERKTNFIIKTFISDEKELKLLSSSEKSIISADLYNDLQNDFPTKSDGVRFSFCCTAKENILSFLESNGYDTRTINLNFQNNCPK